MKRKRRMTGIETCILIWITTSCAHQTGITRSENGQSVESYYPLTVGNKWVYQTKFQGSTQNDLEVSLVATEDGYYIDNRPTPSRLRHDREGLRDGTVRYLLRKPLELGTKWMSVADVRTVEHYEIVSVGKKVSVPAGSFSDCVAVRMTVRIDGRRAMENLMTFSPGVGIVSVETILKDGEKTIPQSEMALKSYKLVTP